MSDQPSSRDEKGLTLSGRTMLRILMEFGKALTASRKLGEDKGFELFQNPSILLRGKVLALARGRDGQEDRERQGRGGLLVSAR